MLWEMATAAFIGGFSLRFGELLPQSELSWEAAAYLARGDFSVDNLESPTLVQIDLRLKCDQEGSSADVIFGKISTAVCPVEAMYCYLLRGPAQEPFFLDHVSQTVSKAWFVQQPKITLQKICLPVDQYTGHHFIIGATTSAALTGVEDLGEVVCVAILRYWHALCHRAMNQEEQYTLYQILVIHLIVHCRCHESQFLYLVILSLGGQFGGKEASYSTAT